MILLAGWGNYFGLLSASIAASIASKQVAACAAIAGRDSPPYVLLIIAGDAAGM